MPLWTKVLPVICKWVRQQISFLSEASAHITLPDHFGRLFFSELDCTFSVVAALVSDQNPGIYTLFRLKSRLNTTHLLRFNCSFHYKLTWSDSAPPDRRQILNSNFTLLGVFWSDSCNFLFGNNNLEHSTKSLVRIVVGLIGTTKNQNQT